MSATYDDNRIIGELLVKKSFVTLEQVQSALLIQSDKPHLRIGEILLSMGLITIEQLDTILSEHLSHQFIGALLLSQGFISQEQLANATAVQESSNRRFGEILLELGYVTDYQLNRLLNTQRMLRKPRNEFCQLFGRYKKTKIVATLGPACSSDETVCAMINAGVNIFRINFSHGAYKDHQENIERVRRVAAKMRTTVGILQDIQGPKIRIGEVTGGKVQLQAGELIKFLPGDGPCNEQQCYVLYDRLLQDIQPGASVLIDDGRIEAIVEEVTGEALLARIKNGGPLSSKKGVNFPGSYIHISVLTPKDRKDLVFGIEAGVDIVAASFIQTARDVADVKEFLQSNGSKTPVIAKIETREAVRTLQEILGVADGVMVARGDLGVEFPSEDVPLIQKQIIGQAIIAARPVITATQMLDSMVNSPRPTRAEASDVANAIIDGTDAVMLSNETAVGKYALEAVETMCRIIHKAEAMEGRHKYVEAETQRDIIEAITSAATHLASDVGAAAIIVPSMSGSAARLISRFRPRTLIIASSSDERICRQMMLLWGVYPLHLQGGDSERMHPQTMVSAQAEGLLVPGNLVVIMEAVKGLAGRSRGIRLETVVSMERELVEHATPEPAVAEV
jgi:pyruvate kinase